LVMIPLAYSLRVAKSVVRSVKKLRDLLQFALLATLKSRTELFYAPANTFLHEQLIPLWQVIYHIHALWSKMATFTLYKV
jgi:hypothetical protein